MRTCVLGMHRSGTSCVAGALAAAGVEMGAAPGSGGRHNARGNHENHEVVVLHEVILRRAGGSWDRPPAEIVWLDRDREQAVALMARYPESSPAGFKDPRTLLHWEAWRTLPVELRPVGVIRDPSACAASLAERDGMSRAAALGLWTHYNRRLLAIWREQPFPVVDFDLDEDALARALDDVVASQVAAVDRVGSASFEAALRHTAAPTSTAPGDLPEETARLYAELLEIAREPSRTGGSDS